MLPLEAPEEIDAARGGHCSKPLPNLGAIIACVRLEERQAGGNTKVNGEPTGNLDAPLCDKQCNNRSHMVRKLASLALERRVRTIWMSMDAPRRRKRPTIAAWTELKGLLGDAVREQRVL